MSWLRDLIWQMPDALSIKELESSGLFEAARNGRIFDPVAE
jgi:hypothetical protein